MRVYRCAICKAEVSLGDLNEQMQCPDCGEPDDDGHEDLDPSVEGMLAEHGTWGL